MQVKRIARNTLPLCFLPNGNLLCYHQGKVNIINGGVVEKTILIPLSFNVRLLGRNRIISRLLRFGVRAAEMIDDNHVILSIGHSLFELDVEQGSISSGWDCGTGIRPLIMTTIKDINGFKDGVYFGGYLRNKEKKPVNIYRRNGIDQWEVVYTFPLGEINHVHNIIADPYRKCLWIFTGDFDESAAIWKVTDNFQKVERVVCNNQKYRGCVAYALPDGLLYATDAPFADNYIYFMNPNTYESQKLFPLHGSCIYGCQWKDQFVFSSTVESDGRTPRRWSLFYRESDRGSGIKDDFVHMYLGNLSNGFKEIYKEKKDWLSLIFQFGVFKFPYGTNESETLFFQPVSTNKNDSCLMAYNNTIE